MGDRYVHPFIVLVFLAQEAPTEHGLPDNIGDHPVAEVVWLCKVVTVRRLGVHPLVLQRFPCIAFQVIAPRTERLQAVLGIPGSRIFVIAEG